MAAGAPKGEYAHRMESNFKIIVEQYIGKWVKLLSSKTATCTEAEALADAEKLQSILFKNEKVELSEKGKTVTITVSNGPIRVSVKESFF